MTKENTIGESQLAFSLCGELMAIDVHSVVEVMDMKPLSKLPVKVNMVLGLLSHGGQYIPVVDSYAKFSMGEAPEPEKKVLVIIEVPAEDNNKSKLAFTADKVLGVVSFLPETIRDMPIIGSGKVDYVLGIADSGDNSYMILDACKLFSISEMKVLEQVSLEITK
jgi:chemotaxis signal transduction protein